MSRYEVNILIFDPKVVTFPNLNFCYINHVTLTQMYILYFYHIYHHAKF
jgi:hypothetical protein